MDDVSEALRALVPRPGVSQSVTTSPHLFLIFLKLAQETSENVRIAFETVLEAAAAQFDAQDAPVIGALLMKELQCTADGDPEKHKALTRRLAAKAAAGCVEKLDRDLVKEAASH